MARVLIMLAALLTLALFALSTILTGACAGAMISNRKNLERKTGDQLVKSTMFFILLVAEIVALGVMP